MPIQAQPLPDSLGNLAAVEAELCDLVRAMPTAPGPAGPGRPAILPAAALWAGLLVAVLRGFSSQLDLWRLLSIRQLWYFPRFPVSDQAVYKRLAQSSSNGLEALFVRFSAVLAARLAGKPALKVAAFATQVVAIDGSTLDQITRHLPLLRQLPAGDPRLLGGKIAGMFDLRLQQWRTVQVIDDPNQNDKVAARDLVSTLPPQSLVVADLGYFGYAWFDWLTDHGYWWVSRVRKDTSYQVVHTFYHQGETFDGLVWLGAYRADRAALAVRLITYRKGPNLHRYITNVLDPYRFPLADVAQVYARRWDIEMAFLHVKRHLGLHLLWSGQPQVIQAQVWAVLIIAQALLALRQEIAHQAGCDYFEVSLGLMVKYLPRFAAQGLDPVAAFVESGWEAGFLRPSRRITIRAPEIPESDLVPCPPDLVLVQTPRHANKSRPAKPN